jgi:hypothetical protein
VLGIRIPGPRYLVFIKDTELHLFIPCALRRNFRSLEI